MRALVLGSSGPHLVHDHPDPDRPGEAVIRLLRGGVCATDLELIKGYMGFEGVLGHEFVGLVEEAPERGWVGRRVVGGINCPCGACATCSAGRPTHCPHRTVLGIAGRDGVFSERFSLPLDNLRFVPDFVSDDAAAFVEPLAAACRILEQVRIGPTDRVTVLGVGRLGQLCARVLALTGATVIAVSRNPDRLALLPPDILRATLDEVDVAAGSDVVVDCTGAPGGLAQATALVRPGGTIVLKTTVTEPAPVAPTPWVIDEVTVVGSRCGPFEPAIRLLASGRVDPRPLVSATFDLDQGLEALEAAGRRENVKILLRP